MASSYVCANCGFTSASWYGRCPECQEWNSFKKFNQGKKSKSGIGTVKAASFKPLTAKKSLSDKRISTGIYEFDRVLGGGFISSEVVLLAGEPGVGKSTLLLKLLNSLRAMYISGEESGDQIKQRADRMGVSLKNVQFSSDIDVISLTQALTDAIDDFDIVIVDSIQTVYASSIEATLGSVSQIKEASARLTEFAKQHNKVVVIVGHVTKGGDIAGPKMLEHLVDCVLYLEGERQSHYRIIRARKNRFGPTDEVGIFEMKESGLEPVEKPTSLIDTSTSSEPGRSLVASVEGSRALYYEIQSLVVKSSLAVPRSVVSGVEYNRLQLLLAVMRKYMKLKLGTYDIYVNVVGGLSAKTPGADLGIIASILSSVMNKPLPESSAFIGEIGLLGEVRSVYRQDKVITESKRFGLKKVYTSKDVKNVRELKRVLFS